MSARPFMDPAWAAIDIEGDNGSRVALLSSDRFLDLCQILAYWPEALGCPKVYFRPDKSVCLIYRPDPDDANAAQPPFAFFLLRLPASSKNPISFSEFRWSPGSEVQLPKEVVMESGAAVIERLHSIWSHTDIPYDRVQGFPT